MGTEAVLPHHSWPGFESSPRALSCMSSPTPSAPFPVYALSNKGQLCPSIIWELYVKVLRLNYIVLGFFWKKLSCWP